MKPVVSLLAERIRARNGPPVKGGDFSGSDGEDRGDGKPNFAVEGERGGPAGIGMLIVYREADGTETTRRITVSAVQVRDDAPPLVMAHCHEQDVPRTFELDRILSAIDFNGRFFDPQTVFMDLFGLTSKEVQSRRPVEAAWGNNRANITPAAHLLAALALSDGSMDDEEVGIAVRHCSRIAPQLNSQEGLGRIGSFVRGMQPNRTTIAYYVEKLKEKPMSERRLFMKSALELVKSDGVVGRGELELMRALSLELVGVELEP